MPHSDDYDRLLLECARLTTERDKARELAGRLEEENCRLRRAASICLVALCDLPSHSLEAVDE